MVNPSQLCLLSSRPKICNNVLSLHIMRGIIRTRKALECMHSQIGIKLLSSVKKRIFLCFLAFIYLKQRCHGAFIHGQFGISFLCIVKSAYQSGFLQSGRQFWVRDCSTQLKICLNLYLLCFMANIKERYILSTKTRHEDLLKLEEAPCPCAPGTKSRSNRN